MSVAERRSPLSNSCGPLVGTLFFLSVCNSTTERLTYNRPYKKNLLLPQATGHACVDFGCTHAIQLSGWFEVYPSTCWVSSQTLNVGCWVTDLIMPLYHFNFFGLSLAFLYHKVSYHYEV
jgi:hypothetical protein